MKKKFQATVIEYCPDCWSTLFKKIKDKKQCWYCVACDKWFPNKKLN